MVTEKVSETYEGEKLVSKRRSPKKQNIYAIFRELTGLYPWLCHPNFTLDVVCVKVAEERVKTPEPVQLVNRSRRFKRAWYKRDKRLVEQGESRIFTCAADYLALLPPDLGDTFTVKEVKKGGAGHNASLMLWVLERMGLVEFVEKKGTAKVFRLKV